MKEEGNFEFENGYFKKQSGELSSPLLRHFFDVKFSKLPYSKLSTNPLMSLSSKCHFYQIDNVLRVSQIIDEVYLGTYYYKHF